MSGWHENGQKSQEGVFRHDRAQGHFSFWYPNGQKQMEGQFDDGKKVGAWVSWDEQGHKTQTNYRDGEEVPAAPSS